MYSDISKWKLADDAEFKTMTFCRIVFDTATKRARNGIIEWLMCVKRRGIFPKDMRVYIASLIWREYRAEWANGRMSRPRAVKKIKT